MALHRAWEADAERVRRKLQRQAAGRVPERDLVHLNGAGPRSAGCLAAGLQHGHDVLAYMDFPREHRAKLHNTNPIERLNGEIKRRTDVVGIFPNEAAITRLIGAILLEQSDEWATQRARYMTLETISAISDTAPVSLPAVAA